MDKIYCDNQSNTKLDERVFEAMKPFFLDYYGNPQSIYSLGAVSKDAIENARAQTASLINANAAEIIFTSCGSESNNLAIKGLAWRLKEKGRRIIISAIEHFSISNSCKALAKDGFEICIVGVDKNGYVDKQKLKELLNADTILVSVQLANPEIGVIQDIKEIAAMVKQNSSALFHTDAVAACGFIDVDVKDLGVDALTFSASVMYGPKGAAALFLKKGVGIVPLINGGVQENSKRAGTENVPAIVGFGTACEIAKLETAQNSKKIVVLRDYLIKEMSEKIEYIYLNGPRQNRLPQNVNFSIEFIEGEALFLMLDAKGILAASGSACASKNLKMSPVLEALGVEAAVAQGSAILTLSKFNTLLQMEKVVEIFPQVVNTLRAMSPLYSYFQKTGARKEAGPGTDFDHHDHEEINED
ncbi:MAG: cysteine desulfurase [Elusimicrobiota bacterium]|jgi:cysteine desulfurase|nr:cysteine desulfurase [Elusimicrobiota bacterium]